MQRVSAEFQAHLDKGQYEPRVLIDTFEMYDPDYIPGDDGFDPADALELFAPAEFDWNGNSYRREVISRGDINKSMGEKTNSCSVTFSNISRYLATLNENQVIEGCLFVIRTLTPLIEDESLVLFVGRCDKPSDIDKKEFSLSARQDFGNINQTLPPRKFSAQDPEGRLPSDPLFEGINFVAVFGTNTFPVVGPATHFFGRLLGQRDTTYRTEQWSSMGGTLNGQVIREIFGRAQLQLRPFAWADKGLYVTYLLEVGNGPILAVENIKTRTEGFSDPFNLPGPIGPVVHLGDAGGTGTNQGNTNQADLGGGSKFSHLAYVEGASTGSKPDATDDPPVVTALVFGRIVPLPDGSGEFVLEGWTDNPVYITRFILTQPKFVNINAGFMADDVNYVTAKYCDTPLVDETNGELIALLSDDIPSAGVDFNRYRSTGVINARSMLYEYLGESALAQNVDGPYIEQNPDDPTLPELPGSTPTYLRQKILRKRYTANFPISEEVRAVDLLYKTLLPSFKGFLRVNKQGKYEIRSEVPSDATRTRAATAIGATSVSVLDVTPWKSGPELLTGRILLGVGLLTSEVRTVSSAVYSTSGNSITLDADVTGGITATASGATLSGGSTSAQATGTVTFGGTPGAGDTVAITIDGIEVVYTLDGDATTAATALMVMGWINANPRLQKYILASWDSGSPNVVTIKCLHGALVVSDPFLKAHTAPVADPVTAPTVAAAGSGSLAAGTYYLAYSDVNSRGSTALTSVASVTLTAGQKINVSSLPAFPAVPAFPGNVTERRFYLSEETGSENLRFITARTDAADFSIDSLPEPGAAMPPAYNTTGEELIRVAMSFATNSQDVYPAWTPNTTLLLDDIRLPTVLNGSSYSVAIAGITGSTEPTWPTSSTPVVDGTVTWDWNGTTVLHQAGLSRSNVLKDSFKFPLGSRQSSVNQIKGNFRDAKNDFALTPFKVNDPVHQAQVKKTYPLEIDLSAVDNWHQAFRLANGALSKYREGDWFNTLGTGPQGLVLEEGDVICSSDDAGGLVNAVTRIEELRIKPNHEVVINQARKYSTNMFSDDVGSHQITIPSTLKLSRPRAVTNVTAVKDASGDWLISCIANPRPIEEPAEVVCEFWVDEDRDDPDNDLKLTLPMVTGTTRACLMAGNTGEYDEETDTFSTTEHAFKNNVQADDLAGVVATSIQAIEETFQRFDFEMASGHEETLLRDDPFVAALHMRADAAGPYSVPDFADCPMSVEVSVPGPSAAYWDPVSSGGMGYPIGTVRVTIRTYGDELLVMEGLDFGYDPFTIVDGEVVNTATNRRAGLRFSFLHNGNEIAIYRDYQTSGGNKHLAKISTGGAELLPLRLTTWMPSDMSGFVNLRNANFGGAIGHSTILALRDQVNPLTFGEELNTIHTRIYVKKTRYNTGDGFPVDSVFPEP